MVGAACLALGLALAAAPRADPYTHARRLVERRTKPWEIPGFRSPETEFTDFFNHAQDRPPLSQRSRPSTEPPTVLLGDLLYHAPRLLGPHTALFGLSCDSCHPNGGASRDLYAEGESDRAGNIDLTFPARTPLADDGVWAPRNIPSLRGARFLAPYLRDGSKATLSEVVQGVVGFEFAQPIRPDWLAALTLYVAQFDFVPNARLDALGRLTDPASPQARAGEAVFRAPRAAFAGLSCASCHAPESLFTDRAVHGLHHGLDATATPGESFKTPTLLNLVESPPYFFDGSAPTLAAAVQQLDQRHRLGLSREQRAQLTAYLEAVGGADRPYRVPSLRERLAASLAYLDLVLDGPLADDAELWPVCLDTVRHQLRAAVRAALPAEAARAEPQVAAFERLVARPEAQRPDPATRTALAALRARLLAAAPEAPRAAEAR